MIKFFYPVLEILVNPKACRCSNCGDIIPKTAALIRTNHGRYCVNCKKVASLENRHLKGALIEGL